jgi:hypothetical protein
MLQTYLLDNVLNIANLNLFSYTHMRPTDKQYNNNNKMKINVFYYHLKNKQ